MKLLLIAGVLAASTISADADEPVEMWAWHGECRALSMAGEDLTDTCNPVVMRTVYADGRATILVMTDGVSGKMFMFSGRDGESGDPGQIVLNVERMAFSPETRGDKGTTATASGQCRLGDASSGVAGISCSVTDAAQNAYLYEFVSNGAPPVDALPR